MPPGSAARDEPRAGWSWTLPAAVPTAARSTPGSVGAFQAAHKLTPYYWMDIFAVCQWPGPEQDRDLPRDFSNPVPADRGQRGQEPRIDREREAERPLDRDGQTDRQLEDRGRERARARRDRQTERARERTSESGTSGRERERGRQPIDRDRHGHVIEERPASPRGSTERPACPRSCAGPRPGLRHRDRGGQRPGAAPKRRRPATRAPPHHAGTPDVPPDGPPAPVRTACVRHLFSPAVPSRRPGFLALVRHQRDGTAPPVRPACAPSLHRRGAGRASSRWCSTGGARRSRAGPGAPNPPAARGPPAATGRTPGTREDSCHAPSLPFLVVFRCPSLPSRVSFHRRLCLSRQVPLRGPAGQRRRARRRVGLAKTPPGPLIRRTALPLQQAFQ